MSFRKRLKHLSGIRTIRVAKLIRCSSNTTTVLNIEMRSNSKRTTVSRFDCVRSMSFGGSNAWFKAHDDDLRVASEVGRSSAGFGGAGGAAG